VKRLGDINKEQYKKSIKESIEFCINEQDELGLDVLVHREVERNNMVEYFRELLDGFVFTQFSWGSPTVHAALNRLFYLVMSPALGR
jgi:5-methyltetrahydropteroyltriglutamate--homocysteine methyltransferase